MVNEQSPLLGGLSEEYTIFSPHQKLMIVIAATSASIFSPLAANIYYPALISIRNELHISKELLNTTITSYMVFQGLSPMFIASYSDTIGRRPVYIFCFVAYIAANIALAYQNTFIGILILRCLQSTGSSSTVNLAYSVTSDVVTSSERGRYIGFASIGPIIGPSFGPILGGIISQQFGWRYIFIFLATTAIVVFIILLGFLPETCRTIVGNGSVPPNSIWNKSIVSWLQDRKFKNDNITESHGITSTRKENPKTPKPLRTLRLLFEYPTCCVLLYNGFSFAVYYSITSSLTFSFHDTYHFDDVQIGLAYVPIGMGTMLAAIGNGFLVDWNYCRIATTLGLKVSKGCNLNHDDCKRAGFSVEKARLQVVIPMVLLANMSMLGYAWSIHLHLNPMIPLIILFVFGFAGTAAYSCMNILIIDLNPNSTATATAANNLVRCFLGSVATAIIIPMIDAIGIGRTFTVIAGVWMSLSPVVLLLLFQNNNRE